MEEVGIINGFDGWLVLTKKGEGKKKKKKKKRGRCRNESVSCVCVCVVRGRSRSQYCSATTPESPKNRCFFFVLRC